MPFAIGIDLGTTTSEVALFDLNEVDPEPKLLEIGEAGRPDVPSVVWFDEARKPEAIIVGSEALRMELTDNSRIVSSVKRQLGKSARHWKNSDTGNPNIPITYLGKSYGPTQISAEILKHLIRSIQDPLIRLNYNPNETYTVVLTVPAEFSLAQKEATVEAAELAGINLAMLLPEPVAAVLAYRSLDRSRERKVLIYDLGGGTLDCTALAVYPDRVNLLAKEGKMDIAGDQFDQRLFKEVLRRVKGKTGLSLEGTTASSRQTRQRILDACRNCKQSVFQSREVPINLLGVYADNGKTFDVEEKLTVQDVENLTRETVDAGKSCIDECIRKAGWNTSDVELVLLVGGSTRFEPVRRMVERLFDPKIVKWDIDPITAVAKGAAIAAGALAKNAPLVKDRLTHSVGYGNPSTKKFVSLIEEGTTVEEAFGKFKIYWQGGQKPLLVDFYESRIKDRPINYEDKGCFYIGTWELLSSPNTALNLSDEIVVSVTCNSRTSMLELEAKDPSGQPLIIRRYIGILAPSERAQFIASLRPGLDLLFVLDASGSMHAAGYWEQIKPLLYLVFDQLASPDWDLRAGLYLFGNETRSYGVYEPALHLELTANKRQFENYLRLLDSCCYTGGADAEPVFDALWQAAFVPMKTSDSSVRAIVLVSDSSTPSSLRENVNLVQLIKELHARQIRIFIIAPYHTDYESLVKDNDFADIEDNDLSFSLTTLYSVLRRDMERRMQDIAQLALKSTDV